MRIEYLGRNEESKDRCACIANIKENELGELENHFKFNKLEFDTFGDYDNGSFTYNTYIGVFDKEEYEEIKQIYKEFKNILKPNKRELAK